MAAEGAETTWFGRSSSGTLPLHGKLFRAAALVGGAAAADGVGVVVSTGIHQHVDMYEELRAHY